jgi:hypothetical protein
MANRCLGVMVSLVLAFTGAVVFTGAPAWATHDAGGIHYLSNKGPDENHPRLRVYVKRSEASAGTGRREVRLKMRREYKNDNYGPWRFSRVKAISPGERKVLRSFALPCSGRLEWQVQRKVRSGPWHSIAAWGSTYRSC